MRIEREKYGFITDLQRDIMYASLPIVVKTDNSDWELITPANWHDWQADLEKVEYTEWAKVQIADDLQHQPSPWISVEERLPSEIGTYLILKNTENGYVDLAQYRSDWGWHNCVFNDPTHWMPIPPIEKGGEK